MNQAEHDVLSDASLPAEAVSLYVRTFRRFRDYQTNCAALSHSRMMQELEFLPQAGSTEQTYRPTKSRVIALIKHLCRVEIIKLVKSGSKQLREPAVYQCCLIEQKANVSLFRQNEEQHGNRQPLQHGNKQPLQHGETQSKPPHLTVFTSDEQHGNKQPVQHGNKQPVQHTSSLPSKTGVYNAGVREDLVFDDQFRLIAKQALLTLEDQDLLDVFDQFKVSSKDDGAARDQGQWLKVWRGYCVNVRINIKKRGGYDAVNQQFSNGSGRQNATAVALAESQRAAEHCAETGNDGSALDRLIELSESELKTGY